MLHHMLFCKRQLDTTKCHYTEEDLGSALDEVTVLLQLGAHAHIAKLVSNSDDLQWKSVNNLLVKQNQSTHHAPDELGVHAPGDEGLLLASEESLNGSLHVLLHGTIQGLGGGDAAYNLATVGGHQGTERADDGIKVANSDKTLTITTQTFETTDSPVVLGKGDKEVGGELVEAELLAGAVESVNLEGVLDGGVQEKLGKSGIRLHGSLKLFLQTKKNHIGTFRYKSVTYQISLNNVEGLLLLGGGEKGRGVATLDAVHGDGGLDQGGLGGGGGEAPCEHAEASSGGHPRSV